MPVQSGAPSSEERCSLPRSVPTSPPSSAQPSTRASNRASPFLRRALVAPPQEELGLTALVSALQAAR
eukprot:2106534-Alexandrium_andersonii.AAC.1